MREEWSTLFLRRITSLLDSCTKTVDLPGPSVVNLPVLCVCSQALQEMGCELRVFEASNKIKACLMTAKGMIGVVLQVYLSDGAGSPSMVEVGREFC